MNLRFWERKPDWCRNQTPKRFEELQELIEFAYLSAWVECPDCGRLTHSHLTFSKEELVMLKEILKAKE